jgi:hypothetical protein
LIFGKVEAIEVHHLGPRRHEVFHKLLLGVCARIPSTFCTSVHIRTAPTGTTLDTTLAAYNFLRRQGSAPSNTTKENQNEDISAYGYALASATYYWV